MAFKFLEDTEPEFNAWIVKQIGKGVSFDEENIKTLWRCWCQGWRVGERDDETSRIRIDWGALCRWIEVTNGIFGQSGIRASWDPDDAARKFIVFYVEAPTVDEGLALERRWVDETRGLLGDFRLSVSIADPDQGIPDQGIWELRWEEFKSWLQQVNMFCRDDRVLSKMVELEKCNAVPGDKK